jgi:hypothetical protein
MTLPCSHLDEFFDGELARDAAATFRTHLATCDHCQRQLDGRMQEKMVVGEAAPVSAGVVPIARARPPKAGNTRVIAIAGIALLCAAAAVLLVLRPREPDRPPQLAMAFTVEHTGPTMRGADAHVGDIIHIQSGDIVWIYRNDHELVLACPGAPSCRAVGVDFTVSAIGTYSIVVLAGGHVTAPHGNLDADLAAVHVPFKIVPLNAD